MQFSTVALSALFTAIVSAGPIAIRSTEAITISSFDVRNIDGAISASSLDITTTDSTTISCTSDSGCTVDGWSYQVKENALDNYLLSVYKQTGAASGIYDQKNVTLICHAGGSSATDYACDQLPIISVTMNLNPDGASGDASA